MNWSNRQCHLCQVRDNDETMQHLFLKCLSVKKKVIKEIEAISQDWLYFTLFLRILHISHFEKNNIF
jgi:hypothetical protein